MYTDSQNIKIVLFLASQVGVCNTWEWIMKPYAIKGVYMNVPKNNIIVSLFILWTHNNNGVLGRMKLPWSNVYKHKGKKYLGKK